MYKVLLALARYENDSRVYYSVFFKFDLCYLAETFDTYSKVF